MLRTALPRGSSRHRSPSGFRRTGDNAAPLYLGGIVLVVLFAALIWTGLF